MLCHHRVATAAQLSLCLLSICDTPGPSVPQPLRHSVDGIRLLEKRTNSVLLAVLAPKAQPCASPWPQASASGTWLPSLETPAARKANALVVVSIQSRRIRLPSTAGKKHDFQQFATGVTEAVDEEALMAPSPIISTHSLVTCQTAGHGESVPGR